jgi:hypothetical protein
MLAEGLRRQVPVPIEGEGGEGGPKGEGEFPLRVSEAIMETGTGFLQEPQGQEPQGDTDQEQGDDPAETPDVKIPQVRAEEALTAKGQESGDDESRNNEEHRHPEPTVDPKFEPHRSEPSGGRGLSEVMAPKVGREDSQDGKGPDHVNDLKTFSGSVAGGRPLDRRTTRGGAHFGRSDLKESLEDLGGLGGLGDQEEIGPSAEDHQ